jgi:hypothetical protein
MKTKFYSCPRCKNKFIDDEFKLKCSASINNYLCNFYCARENIAIECYFDTEDIWFYDYKNDYSINFSSKNGNFPYIKPVGTKQEIALQLNDFYEKYKKLELFI